MATSIAQKLRIGDGSKLLSINAPDDFARQIGPLPGGANISAKQKDYNQIHWFVKNKAQLDTELSKVLDLLKPGVLCWLYFPKGSSKIQTDLTRDKGWEEIMENKNLQWINLISFNDTWSAFAIRLKSEADQKKKSKPVEKPVLAYADSATKTIRLPEDLSAAMKKSKKGLQFFDSLSFSNKREYVEWVVSAKREETRMERIKGTIERLEKNWKNPRNL